MQIKFVKCQLCEERGLCVWVGSCQGRAGRVWARLLFGLTLDAGLALLSVFLTNAPSSSDTNHTRGDGGNFAQWGSDFIWDTFFVSFSRKSYHFRKPKKQSFVFLSNFFFFYLPTEVHWTGFGFLSKYHPCLTVWPSKPTISEGGCWMHLYLMLQWCSAKQFLKIWHQEKQRWNLLKDNYPVLKKLYCELAKLPCFAVCSCIDRLGRNKGVAGWPHTNRLLTDLIFKVLILTENKSDGLCRSIAVKTSVTCYFCFVFFISLSSLGHSVVPSPLRTQFYQLLRISLPLWTQFFHFSLPQPSWTCSSQMGEQKDETWSSVWGSSNTVWFPWKRPEKYGAKGAYKCLTSMSVVQVKSKPASISPQAPPWNSLLRLFSCVATRSVHRTKGITLKTVKHTKSPLSSPHHQLNAFVRVSAG